MISAARTSPTVAPISASPATRTSHDSSVGQPVSTSAMPSDSSIAYTSTYRSGLSGIGTGSDQRPGRTFSTDGITRARQASRCAVPVTTTIS